MPAQWACTLPLTRRHRRLTARGKSCGAVTWESVSAQTCVFRARKAI